MHDFKDARVAGEFGRDGTADDLAARDHAHDAVAVGGDRLAVVLLRIFHAQARAQVARGCRVEHHIGVADADLVGFFLHRNAFHEINERHRAVHIRHARAGVRVPRGGDVADRDGGAVGGEKRGAVGEFVLVALAAAFVAHDQFARAAQHDFLALAVFLGAHIFQLHGAGVFDFHLADARLRGRAADVEGAHGQLRARLADGLRGDDADRLADVDHMPAPEVAPVALGADAEAGFAGDRRAHLDFVDVCLLDFFDQFLVQHLLAGRHHFPRGRVHRGLGAKPPEQPVFERHHHLAALHLRGAHQAFFGAAVLLGDHQVLAHIHQAARHVAGRRGLERGVGQPLARAVGGDEILQHIQPLAEVGGDRRFHDRAVGLRHQAAHAGELPHLRDGAARAGIGHHVNGVERLLLDRLALAVDRALGGEVPHHGFGDLLAGARPDVHDFVVALAVGEQAVGVLLLNFHHFALRPLQQFRLFAGNDHVFHADGDAGERGHAKPGVHQLVGEDHGLLQADAAVAGVDQFGDGLLFQRPVNQLKIQARRQNLRQNRAPDGGLDQARAAVRRAVGAAQRHAHLHIRMQVRHAVFPGAPRFVDIGEMQAGALRAGGFARHVIQAQHDVLRRHDDRLAVCRRQNVVGGHHQRARLQLRLDGHRHMHRHLVAVKVGVIRRAHQRMQLNRLALDQHRLKRLNAEAVQRRRAVQHDRVLANHLFQNVPDFRNFHLHHALCLADGAGEAAQFQFAVDERLEQFQRHALGQAALVQPQRRADHDDRAPRIVNALAEQVLAEAPLLALDHVGDGFQLALVGAGDRLAAAAVVQQRVHRFLQHAFFVAHDQVGRVQVEQALQAVVAVDHAPVEVVQIRGGEAPAFQRHQRAQVRRQHRQHLQHHPLRLGAGLDERFHHAQAAGEFFDLGFGFGRAHLLAQTRLLLLQVDLAHQRADRLGAHARLKLVAVGLNRLEVGLLAQKRAARKVGQARIDDQIRLKIQHPLHLAHGHVEQQAEPRRQRFQKPDVRARRGQVDVPHALAPHLGQRDLHAAFFADHAAVLEPLVFPAQALVVADRAEQFRAEQSVALRAEGAVVDGLGLANFAV